MERNSNIQREKLFDGKEQDMSGLTISAHDVSFKLSSIIDNQLRNLVQDEKFDQDNFEKIIVDLDFEKKGLLIKNYYKGNLEVYYLINNGHIYFFSFGEFQPTRFILYLEGVYTL